MLSMPVVDVSTLVGRRRQRGARLVVAAWLAVLLVAAAGMGARAVPLGEDRLLRLAR